MGGDLKCKSAAVAGLTFEPNTDDMREAPALTFVPMFVSVGASVSTVDPECMAETR